MKAREAERKKAIAEGLMDDPLVPKRLEDAITMVGTCMDMAPRFERYRRERENNLFEWETVRLSSILCYIEESEICADPAQDPGDEARQPQPRSEDVRARSGGQDATLRPTSAQGSQSA